MAEFDGHQRYSRDFQHTGCREGDDDCDGTNDNNYSGRVGIKRYLVYMELPKIKIGDYHKSSCIVGSSLRFHFLLKIVRNEKDTLTLKPIKAYKVPVVNVAVIHRPFLDDQDAKGPIPKSPNVKSPLIRYTDGNDTSDTESLEEDFRKGSAAKDSAKLARKQEQLLMKEKERRKSEIEREERERKEQEERERREREERERKKQEERERKEQEERERRERERKEQEERERREREERERKEQEERERKEREERERKEREERERREQEERERREQEERKRREQEEREQREQEVKLRMIALRQQKELEEKQQKEQEEREREELERKDWAGPPVDAKQRKRRKKYFVYCELPKVEIGDYRISSVTSSELIHCHFIMKIAQDEVNDQPKLRPIKKYRRPRVNFAVIHRSLLVDEDATGPIPHSPGVRSPMIKEEEDLYGDESAEQEVMHATVGFNYGTESRTKYGLVSQWSLVSDDTGRVMPELVLTKANGNN